jgi:predicted GIY-YIG superfamily endonuclease
MFYVYLLRSEESGKIYTGYSKDMKQRVKDHLSQKVYTTHRMGKVKLIYYEAFMNVRERLN